MGPLLNLIWDICCLRRGPQDLPYSRLVLGVLCAATLGLEVLVAALLGSEQGSIGVGIAALGVYLTVIYLLLTLRGMANRFVQTASALIGCAIVFNLIILPVELLFGTPPDTAQKMSSLQSVLSLVMLLILSWKLMVDANIYRHSLNVPFFTGMLVALGWFLAALYALHLFAASSGTGA
jgi:hypothetical protein